MKDQVPTKQLHSLKLHLLLFIDKKNRSNRYSIFFIPLCHFILAQSTALYPIYPFHLIPPTPPPNPIRDPAYHTDIYIRGSPRQKNKRNRIAYVVIRGYVKDSKPAASEADSNSGEKRGRQGMFEKRRWKAKKKR